MRITPEKRRRAFLLIAVSVALGLFLVAFGPETWKAIGFFLIFVWLIPGVFVLQYFAKPRQRVVAALPTFQSSSPFSPHARAQIAFERPQRANGTSADGPVFKCLFVAESEGFSARLLMDEWTSSFEGAVEFLFPEKARARLSPGTKFVVLLGNSTIGRGVVVGTHG
jgi:hypothetical protein